MTKTDKIPFKMIEFNQGAVCVDHHRVGQVSFILHNRKSKKHEHTQAFINRFHAVGKDFDRYLVKKLTELIIILERQAETAEILEISHDRNDPRGIPFNEGWKRHKLYKNAYLTAI